MKKLLCILACAAALSGARAGNYQNFGVAVYIPDEVVATFSDPKVLESQWDVISRQVKVDKVYIEVGARPDRGEAKPSSTGEAILRGPRRQGRGRRHVHRYTSRSQFQLVLLHRPGRPRLCERDLELTARHFDEIILDDFFFVTTKNDSDIAAKGTGHGPNSGWT